MGAVRMRNEEIQGRGQDEGEASRSVDRGAAGSCSRAVLAECSGQHFFAPSTLGEK